MISRKKLAQEYINFVKKSYPIAGKLIRLCLVRILKYNSAKNHTFYYYLAIYYPDRIGSQLLEQQDIFRDAAENIGLVEVVYYNANYLVTDPSSMIKQQDFRFWLDLCWIAQEEN